MDADSPDHNERTPAQIRTIKFWQLDQLAVTTRKSVQRFHHRLLDLLHLHTALSMSMSITVIAES